MSNLNQTGSGTQGGAFSKLGDVAPGMNFNTPAIQVGNQVRDGDEFVLIVQGKQGESPKIWSSSDQSHTTQLLKTAYNYFSVDSSRQGQDNTSQRQAERTT